MSWRAGSALFVQMWPLIQSKIGDKDHRIEFTSKLLKLMAKEDMDPYDIEDLHPEVREAMRKAGIRISEPDRYVNDAQDLRKKRWWQRG